MIDRLVVINDLAKHQGGACPCLEKRFGEVLRKILDDDAMTKAMSVAAFEGTGDIGLSPEAWAGRLMETYDLAVKA